jgi:hypothetical protein
VALLTLPVDISAHEAITFASPRHEQPPHRHPSSTSCADQHRQTPITITTFLPSVHTTSTTILFFCYSSVATTQDTPLLASTNIFPSLLKSSIQDDKKMEWWWRGILFIAV